MAPVRSKKRINANLLPIPSGHPQQYLSPSDIELDLDYDLDPDSDYPIPTEALPKSPLRTNEELNLQVLHRLNPEITAIVSLATYAVIYTFSSATQGWEKSGVEGTMFVVQLAPEADATYGLYPMERGLEQRYAVFVLNRRGLENFMLELRTEDDVEITDEYVILQKQRGTGDTPEAQESVIYGLWIFAEPEASTADARTFNAEVIQQCAARANSSRSRPYHQDAIFGAEQEKERLRIALEEETMRAQLAAEQELERVRISAEWEAQQSQQAVEREIIERQNADLAAGAARKSALLDLFKGPVQSPLSSQAASGKVNLLDLFKRPTSNVVNPTPTSYPPSWQFGDNYPVKQPTQAYENNQNTADQQYGVFPGIGGSGSYRATQVQHTQPQQQHPLAYNMTNQPQHQQFPPPQPYPSQPPYQSPQYPHNHPSNYAPHIPAQSQHRPNVQSYGNNHCANPPPGLDYIPQPPPTYARVVPPALGFGPGPPLIPPQAPANTGRY